MNYNRLKWSFIIVCAMIIVVNISQQRDSEIRSQETRVHVHQEAPRAEAREASAYEANRLRYREYHSRILTEIAGSDPEGLQTLQFYLDEMEYLHVLPNRRTFGRVDAMNGQKIPIIVMAPNQRAARGVPNPAHWAYEQRLRILIAPLPEAYTDLWAGVFLAHEVSHARQYAINVMAGNNFMREEVRAHRLETRLLDQATNGRYLAQVESWIESHAEAVSEGCVIMHEPSLTMVMQELFAEPISEDEAVVRDAAYMMAVNESLAYQHMDGADRLEGCYRRLYQYFVSHHH